MFDAAVTEPHVLDYSRCCIFRSEHASVPSTKAHARQPKTNTRVDYVRHACCVRVQLRSLKLHTQQHARSRTASNWNPEIDVGSEREREAVKSNFTSGKCVSVAGCSICTAGHKTNGILVCVFWMEGFRWRRRPHSRRSRCWGSAIAVVASPTSSSVCRCRCRVCNRSRTQARLENNGLTGLIYSFVHTFQQTNEGGGGLGRTENSQLGGWRIDVVVDDDAAAWQLCLCVAAGVMHIHIGNRLDMACECAICVAVAFSREYYVNVCWLSYVYGGYTDTSHGYVLYNYIHFQWSISRICTQEMQQWM